MSKRLLESHANSRLGSDPPAPMAQPVFWGSSSLHHLREVVAVTCWAKPCTEGTAGW